MRLGWTHPQDAPRIENKRLHHCQSRGRQHLIRGAHDILGKALYGIHGSPFRDRRHTGLLAPLDKAHEHNAHFV